MTTAQLRENKLKDKMNGKYAVVDFVYFILTLAGELTYNSENTTDYLKIILPILKHLILENPHYHYLGYPTHFT